MPGFDLVLEKYLKHAMNKHTQKTQNTLCKRLEQKTKEVWKGHRKIDPNQQVVGLDISEMKKIESKP